MYLKTGTFSAIAEHVTANKSKIVICGAGVLGSVVTPAILLSNKIDSYVECYIDNDAIRWGSSIKIGSKEVRIYAPAILKNFSVNTVIFIAISRYYDVYMQLLSMECTKEMSCYIIPMLCIENFCDSMGESETVKLTAQPVIPKTLHYMWLGGKPLPDNLKKCIESWEKYCPDYEIVQWDETNYDVHKNVFMAEAYDNGKYGFVPDYARLDILYQYGGIYMDTDVEVIRRLDDLLYQEAFCGVEKWQVINFGGCSGAIKGCAGLEPFLERWSKRKLIRKDGTLDNLSSGLIDTEVALEAGYKINGKSQNVLGINIYSYDYFHPYDYMSGQLKKTNNTYSIHHFCGGWLDKHAQANSRKAAEIYERIMRKMIRVD